MARIQRLLIIWAMFVSFIAAAARANPVSSAQTPLSPDELLLQAAARTPEECDRYKARSWLRQKLVCERDLDRYGLRLNDGWDRTPAQQPIIVLVHGFNSSPQQNVALIKPICDAALPCGSFAYPNDHEIPASAQLMSCELRKFAKRHPERRIILVCHSMGGLVARACIENPQLDPGNVERLIMIAPPTHGSMIAHFAVATDLWEHWLSRKGGGPWRRVRDSIIDGLGEAAGDLCPGSEFLTDLNGRPLNPRVRYSNFLGTGAGIDEAQLIWIRETICDKLARMPGGAGCAERVNAILDDMDELVAGKGDGVVAVKRGRLDGVSDTVVLPFGHLAVTAEPRDESLRAVQRAVLERLR